MTRRRRRLSPAVLLAAALWAGLVGDAGALGRAPHVSPRPHPRPQLAPSAIPPSPPGLAYLAPTASLRPAPRPGPTPTPSPLAARHGKRAVPRAEREGAGWVCGTPAIRGVRITAITSPLPGCGIAAPVRVTAVSGITLDPPAILNCRTAITLNRWVLNGLKPAVGRKGGGVAQIHVAASYACRPRNNVKGAKISEHGRGNAIDLSEFKLADGRTLSVLKDFATTGWMRRAYAAGCGIFGTTLGPGADGYHRTHFHFDTAQYRGGAYCR